jgi:hypothetical protein
MLQHISFGVTDLALAAAFYDAAFVVDPDVYRVEAVINT